MEAAVAEAQRAWPGVDFCGKGPRVVSTAEEYLQEVLLGAPGADVVVFRGGAAALGLDAAATLPAWLVDALAHEATVVGALRRVAAADPGAAAAITARLERDDRGFQREVPPARAAAGTDDVAPDAHRSLAGARCLGAAEAAGADAKGLYACELQTLRRWKREGRWTRSILARSQRAVLGDGARFCVAWDDENDGAFVGARGAGKGLHVDQVNWLNVGINWTGYKVVATWAALDAAPPLDAVLAPPLDGARAAAVARCARVAVLGPGDAFLVSGAAPHATLVVGDGLNCTSYESYVNLEPRVLDALFRTADRGTQAMAADDFRTFLEGCVAALARIAPAPRPRVDTCAFAVSAPVAKAVAAVLGELFVDAVRAFDARGASLGVAVPPALRHAAAAVANRTRCRLPLPAD